MIGTTRKINESISTIDFTRLPSHGSQNPSKEQRESIIFRLYPEKEGKRLIFQIGTSDPGRAVQAARIVAGDVAGIDVNAGCPKPFSTSGGMGAVLLQTPDKLCSILEALVKEIVPEFQIGISVKIRLLETPELTEVLVRKLCATGITGLTIHCRTTPMRPRERAIREQLKMVADICKENGVACLMNGDVETRAQAEQLIAEYGVDGAMIATAAETNSSCFRSEADGGLAPWREVVESYLKTSMEVENRWGNTKYLLGQMVPGKDPLYREILSSKNYHQICQILKFEHLEVQANKVDEKLGVAINTLVDNSTIGRKGKGKKNATALAVSGNQNRQQHLNKKRKLSERGVQNEQTEVPGFVGLEGSEELVAAQA